MRGIHGYSEALSGAVKSLDPNPMNDKLTDHARGCQGREYVCTCGYDDQIDTDITQLSTLYSNAIARAEKAEEALRVAVMAERERCAKIAEDDVPADCAYGPGKGIAANIRISSGHLQTPIKEPVMTQFPEDISKAAIEAVLESNLEVPRNNDVLNTVAKAITAERERCASIAYVEAVKHCSARDGMTLIGHSVGHSIAAAIRTPPPVRETP